MSEISLNQSLKKLSILNTDVGDFTYVKSLGEGGNSFVFLFSKEGMYFAIKFLKPSNTNKLKRFKDEYFCTMQISTHEHVVQTYHFDSVLVAKDSYYIIIMKYYPGVLNSIGDIASEGDDVKGIKGWNLFCGLVGALGHLHKSKIIHRDVKPQNIFFDDELDGYVLGDLGIAHFSDDVFPKESKTKSSEKMANFSFSAPEQLDSKSPVKETCDIYSLGQVLQWYLTGKTIRGLGRDLLSSRDSPKKLKWLDSVIDKCLRNDPILRFQTITEILSYVEELKNPPKENYWKNLHKFDDVIRRSFTKINGVLSTSDSSQIERFLCNFHDQCKGNDFWYMTLDGGDNTYEGLISIDNHQWLFCREVELDIKNLIVYRDNGYPYKNFFVLLISPSKPFDIVDSKGVGLKTNITPESTRDYAVLWNKKYIDYKETENGYYEVEGEVITVDRKSFKDRMRHLQEYAYIIVPKGTATAIMGDRTPTQRFLEDIVKNGEVTDSALEEYLDQTRSHHSREITMYN